MQFSGAYPWKWLLKKPYTVSAWEATCWTRGTHDLSSSSE